MADETTSHKARINGGLELTVVEQELDIDSCLEQILSKLDTQKGGIFSSGLEYPGRHSRWDN